MGRQILNLCYTRAMTPRGGKRTGAGRPTKSDAGPGVKKNIRFTQEGAAEIEVGARSLGMTFAALIEAAVSEYLARRGIKPSPEQGP